MTIPLIIASLILLGIVCLMIGSLVADKTRFVTLFKEPNPTGDPAKDKFSFGRVMGTVVVFVCLAYTGLQLIKTGQFTDGPVHYLTFAGSLYGITTLKAFGKS